MDAHKVWQWRIALVKRYSRCANPFYFSNRIGLDFNVGSSAQKKLELQLATNGVILEICNFAEVVKRCKRRLLTNILENNFDLGFENHQQRIEFSSRTHYKVKELIRKPPKDKNEVFTLFDTSSKAEHNSNDGLTTASSEHLVEMDESDHSEHEDEFEFSQVIPKEYLQTEGLSSEIDKASSDDGEHEYEFKHSRAQSAEELREDCPLPLFPYCEGIGLNFDVGSKQSLDPDLLTKGVMLELVHFTRILTSSYGPTVLDVLEHNFELDLKSQQEKIQLWLKISGLLRRRKRLLVIGTEIDIDFKDEPFSFQTNPLERGLSNVEASKYHLSDVMKRRQSDLKSNQKKRALSRSSERANKRHRVGQFEDMETNSLSHHTDLCTSEEEEGDHSHTFPQGESDQDSDKVTNPGYTSKLDHLQSPKGCSLNSDIAGDSEPSSLGFCSPLLTTSEISSSSPTVNSNVNSSFASQPDERGLCGGEEPTRTPRNASNKHDMEQDEMGTEIMWKLRANRVKQILSSEKTKFGQFTMSKKAGLEFNVGFGPKKNISVDSLSNSVLLEVAKFALAMNSSQQDFIMEILEYNFDFGLQSQHQRDVFICEIMKRVRTLRSCEDGVRFSKEVFQLPGPMSSKMNMANQSVVGVDPELSSELRIKECAVVLVRLPHSHAETKQLTLQKIVDFYPICKKIGLKLHVNKSQPSKKLDINRLTNGAMTEVMNLAEKLCGTFEQICLDILRHNFDLDSHSGDSDFARDILAQIPAIMEQKNLSNCASLNRKIIGTGTDCSTMMQLDCQNSPNLDASSAGSSEAATIDQYVEASADIQLEDEDEHNLTLWKLRASHIEYILSVPHEEHCPLYSYSRCKKIGINFNVGSGVKQNLDPKLLTNGIMIELTRFATALVSSQRYFITDILEYNFHLDFKNELHRSAFALKTWKVLKPARNSKKFHGPRLYMPFELPDPSNIQEFTNCCPRCYQVRTDKLHQDVSDPGHMHHSRPHTMTDTFLADANSTAQKPTKDLSSTLSAAVETIIDRYSRCKKIGLNLCVDKDQPKDKMDSHLLTNGVMAEVYSFAIKLCGTKYKIINDVLLHNFKSGMQMQDIIFSPVYTAMLKKTVSQAWLNETFVIQQYPQKPFRHASKAKKATSMRTSELKESFKNRKLALQTKGKVTASERTGTESHYTCPLGESDLDWGDITDSGVEEQTQTLRNEPTECDMEQEEMGTETLWKLRANRVNHILSSPNGAFGEYPWYKKLGLEFNVGFGPKQHISADSLSVSVLLEVAKFALAMNSSEQDFIMEILEYNFDFGLQSQHQRDFFICEIMKRIRISKSCEDAVRFSKKYLQLPGPMSSVNMANQSMSSVNPELSSELRLEDCDVAPVCPSDLNAKSKEHISQKVMDLFPLCNKIGLKLHVNKSQPNKKLDISRLNTKAMAEVKNFTRQLCGTFEQICLDILRHNFDLDSHSGDSDLARDILAQIPAIVDQIDPSDRKFLSRKLIGTGTDCLTVMQLDCQNSPNLDASSAGSSEAVTIDQYVEASADIQLEDEDEHNLTLWKLRASHIEYILSAPHEEHCPLYSYSRCKKIGIKFNVGSGVKQNLDLKLLTNGITIELLRFATALVSSQMYFITDILEYNFHLDFKNELHRSAFALRTWKAVIAARNSRNFKAARVFKPFVLPDLSNIQESTNCCPRCYQVRTDKLHQDVSDPGHMHHSLSAAVEPIIDRYSLCKKIGLNLYVDKDQPKDKVDLHLLTNGVMAEVYSFILKLCGIKSKIIIDVLEHNFKSGMQMRSLAYAVMSRKIVSQAWLNETFSIQQYPQKQLRHASGVKRATSTRTSELKAVCEKRKLALQTKENASTAQEDVEKESNYSCYPGGTDLDLNDITDSGGEEQTESLVPNECDMEQDEMGTAIMWKLRANRVKQILSSPNREFGHFIWSKKAGIRYNVGFAPKQHISVDSVSNYALLEVAKFALAMNSSQQDFIMEILEYNFDFGLQSQHQRDVFICEILKRLRKLRSCSDGVRFSKEVFELPAPMLSLNMANQSMGSVNPELGIESRLEECDAAPVCPSDSHTESIETRLEECDAAPVCPSDSHTESIESRLEECDAAPVCPSDSHTESKEHISEMTVDPYPFCKEIGLKLHVNNRKQNTKLDINKLTNGAMTEVTNFAEELCGTFEQIYLDILRHNLDFDLEGVNARSTVAAAREQKGLSLNISKYFKIQGTNATNPNQDCQNDQTLDASSAGSSKATVMDDNTDHPEELDLKLWKLRYNQMQKILSIPHGEHCPLYSYPRCKKLGIDFNVGSGVKQNLDPKLLTNGIMAEVDTFAKELLSAEKYFITEILEYNFQLDFKSELHHSAFELETRKKVLPLKKYKLSPPRMNIPLELPDIQEPTPESLNYCPKCYQDRIDQLHQDESNPSEMHHPHPHTMLDTVSADASYVGQKPAKDPSLTPSATEEAIMDRYPYCKKIGLNLCVNKDKPKDKLDVRVLTRGIVVEVASFAKILCVSKYKSIPAIIEKNFNMNLPDMTVWYPLWLSKGKDGGHDWLDEVFFPRQRQYKVSKPAKGSLMPISERKETTKKRMLALLSMEERPTLPSPYTSVVKSKTYQHNEGKYYPHCTRIGLDLDVKSKSGEKAKLDLNLLTRAVVCEMHKFAMKHPGNYWPHTVFDILDYNFDLSSQHYRRWEFSIAISSKVQSMVKQRDLNRKRPHEVFKLPFILAPKTQNEEPKKHSKKEPDKKKRKRRNRSDSSDVDFVNGDKTNKVARSHDKDTELPVDPWSASPTCGSPVSEGRDSPVQGNIQIGEEEDDPHFGTINSELDTETTVQMSGSPESGPCGSPVQGNIQTKEEKYDPQNGTMKPELDTGTTVQMSGSPESGPCGSPVQGNIQTKEEKYDPQNGTMKPELDTGTTVQMSGSLESGPCGSPVQGNIQTKEEKYDPQNGTMKPELDTGTTGQMSGNLVSVACGSPLLANVQKKEEHEPHYGDMKSEPEAEMFVPMSGSSVSEGSDNPLQGNAQIKEEYNPHSGNIKPEPDTEKKHNDDDDVKTKSTTEDAQHFPGVATGFVGYMPVAVLPNFAGPQAGLQNQYVQCYILAKPQEPAILPDAVSNITPRLNPESVQYLVPLQAVACPMVTIGAGNESTLITQEQENVPADLQQGEVHRK